MRRRRSINRAEAETQDLFWRDVMHHVAQRNAWAPVGFRGGLRSSREVLREGMLFFRIGGEIAVGKMGNVPNAKSAGIGRLVFEFAGSSAIDS